MFAVIRSGGKQYRVAPADVITVERLDADAGAKVELTDILALSDGQAVTLGTPNVDGASVAATVVEHTRADKLIIFRKKRRKNHRRKRGHRQALTAIRINEIRGADGAVIAKEEAPKAAKKPAKKTRKKKAAAKPKAKAAAKPEAEADTEAEADEVAAPAGETAPEPAAASEDKAAPKPKDEARDAKPAERDETAGTDDEETR